MKLATLANGTPDGRLHIVSRDHQRWTPARTVAIASSDRFFAPGADVPFPAEEDGIDFEREFGVITDATPMGTSAAAARDHMRLAVQINDWSLRHIAPIEMKTGFGWIQAKPACSMAPVASAAPTFVVTRGYSANRCFSGVFPPSRFRPKAGKMQLQATLRYPLTAPLVMPLRMKRCPAR